MLLRQHVHARAARSRALALVTALSILFLSGGRALALDPPEQLPPEELPPEVAAMSEQEVFAPEAEAAWTLMWNRPGPSGVVSGTAELGILRAGQISSERNYIGGLQLQALGAGPRWPIMLGLGGGNLWLAHSRQRGPRFTLEGDDEEWTVSSSVERSLEIRHVELMARFQPLWGWVRPYLEGFFGMSILRQSAVIMDRRGETLAEQDPQRSVGMLYGGTLGVDLGGGAFGCTLGVKRTRTSRIERIVLEDRDDSWTLSENKRRALGIWSPFIGLTLKL